MTSPTVGFFTSALFTHHALQWLWSYTVEFHPRWLYEQSMKSGGRATGGACYRRWRSIRTLPPVYAPVDHRRGDQRPKLPDGRAFRHTSAPVSPIDTFPLRRSSRASYLEHVSRAAHAVLDPPPAQPLGLGTIHRIVDLVASCVYTEKTRDARSQLRRFVGERLWPQCSSEAVAIELLALQGNLDAAHSRFAALLSQHEALLRHLQAQSLQGMHTRQRGENATLDAVYRAATAVLSTWVENCMHEKAQSVYSGMTADRAAAWFWEHPLILAMAQPPFPKVVHSIYTLLSSLVDPHAHLQRILTMQRPSDERAHFASVLVLAYANRGSPHMSAQLMNEVMASEIMPHEGAVRRVLRTIAPLRDRDLAQPLIQWLEQYSRSATTFSVLAMYYAELGDVDGMERALIRCPYSSGSLCARARLVCAASRGDVAAVHHRIGPVLQTEEDAFWLLRAHVRSNDMAGARQVFLDATQEYASERLYGEMARMVARMGHTNEALDIAAQLEGVGIVCTPTTLTYLVQALGRAHLPERAAALVARQFERGTRPALRVYTALMDAYIRVGHYVAAQGIFQWLQTQHDPSLLPDTSAYNTLLKAHVHKGTPVKHVVQFLLDMRRQRLMPDARTYALVVQSACDARRLRLAEQLFDLADRSLQGGASLQLHTILIHAHLKANDTIRARELLEQVERRGMEPSYITYAVLLHSYANGTESSLQIAQDLALRLIDQASSPQEPRTWTVPALEQGPMLENLLVPLIDAHGKRGDIWEAQYLFRRLLHGSEPLSPQALTVMMNAHRSAGDVEGVLRLWDELYAMMTLRAQADVSAADTLVGSIGATMSLTTPSADASPCIGPFQRNLLCIPLSLTIDTASRAGLHDRVAEIWTQAKRDGFAFDAQNYNHLCRALARADRVPDALRIVQHVLYESPPSLKHVDDPAPADFITHLGAKQTVKEYAANPLYQARLTSQNDARTAVPVSPPNRRKHRFTPTYLQQCQDSVDAQPDGILQDTNLLHGRELWFASLNTMRTLSEALEKHRPRRDEWLALFPRAAERLDECRKYCPRAFA